MQFSESWLRSFVNPAITTAELSHLMTMAGLEVEEERKAAPPFTGIVVAQVLSVEQHPNADKLKVCKVDVGTGTLRCCRSSSIRMRTSSRFARSTWAPALC